MKIEETKWLSETEVNVIVKSGTLTPGRHEVVVVNKPPDADASRPYEITVEA